MWYMQHFPIILGHVDCINYNGPQPTLPHQLPTGNDILEVLGKVIDHHIPDPFVHVLSSSSDMLVQLGGNLLYPEMHFWSLEILEE